MANKYNSKYNDLSESDKDKILEIVNSKEGTNKERYETAAKYIGTVERNFRRILKQIKIERGIINPENIEDTQEFKTAQSRVVKKSKYYIITWCQNETPIHKQFFDNIEVYAKFLGAEIIVIAGRYQNPTSVFVEAKNQNWDVRVQKYLCANRIDLNDNLQVLSDVKTQPTAANPLTGFDTITREQSCILGHPKIHFQSMPVKEGYNNKILQTTGACSYENYTDSKAGKKAEFNHQFGFSIVEIKDKETFYTRQVIANDNGSFTDLFFHVDNTVKPIENYESIILGDLHLWEHDQKLIDSKMHLINMSKTCVFHDVFNGTSISHHNKDFEKIQYIKEGKNILSNELNHMYEWLKSFHNKTKSVKKYIVQSNHDEHLDKYIENVNWKFDLINAQIFFELATLKATQNIRCIIKHLIEQNVRNYSYIGLDDILRIKNYELSLHGHQGSNGARGSKMQFAKINTKNITGHTHSPFRFDVHIGVGTNTKIPMNYQKGGMSSSMHADAIIHNDGKAQLILFINNRYTTLYRKYKLLL